jgi:hypothetical protein
MTRRTRRTKTELLANRDALVIATQAHAFQLDRYRSSGSLTDRAGALEQQGIVRHLALAWRQGSAFSSAHASVQVLATPVRETQRDLSAPPVDAVGEERRGRPLAIDSIVGGVTRRDALPVRAAQRPHLVCPVQDSFSSFARGDYRYRRMVSVAWQAQWACSCRPKTCSRSPS